MTDEATTESGLKTFGDLIKEIVDEDTAFQWLNPAITCLESKGRGEDKRTHVTFATDIDFDVDGLDKIGLVLFIDREDIIAFKERHQL